MAVIISAAIEKKIGNDDHGNVTRREVQECFMNHDGRYAYDLRPQHQDSNGNPSPWFVSETNAGRKLKIMFVLEHGDIYLKSAYPATPGVQALYEAKAE